MDTRLIIRYLEGHLELEQERELFDWLNASGQNMQLFREVEAEWKAKHIPSVESLQTVQSLRKAINSHRANRLKNVRRWISAASVAAMLAGAVVYGISCHFFGSGDEKQRFAVEAPMGAYSKVLLPDGTKVWLNAGSVLSYDSDFNREYRDIDLNGEAYFEVMHDAAKPFRVHADGCSFTVLGTKFNIKAYADNGMVQTVLVEGSLRFENEETRDIMSPGEMILWNPSEKTYSKEKVNARQYCSWINGVVLYDSITLPELLQRLSREYNVNICLDTDLFNGKSFRVSYTDGESVDAIFSALSRILPIAVTWKDGKYHVGCRSDN
ncbi:MAG: FecR domain-containing protein [Bacteroidales bacterium]|nr:FecR domain-containing protein [Bacteroides sp.]MCM1197457.1 FecR domain-containing protein [Clostridium sp.]MCM1501177.1 FecR domain-containing protein [Bacteroidales bacterium]